MGSSEQKSSDQLGLPSRRMRNSTTAISFFILVAVIGSQAGIIHETILEEMRSKIHDFKPPVIHQGVHGSSDCCFSYVSRIPCSKFVSYFSTSGGCIKPGIIFVTKKRNQVCANPSDQRVQECTKRLTQIIRSGNQAIA